jgi:hypothetical protein
LSAAPSADSDLFDPPHALREYAFVADGERGALIGPRGDFAWMCFPRWHDDAVFCSLIGGTSTYGVRPTGRFVWGGYYEHGTLIWRSRWIAEEGIVECREALALPADPGRAVLLRRIKVTRGRVRMEAVLNPGAGFDRHRMTHLRRTDEGIWEARLGESRMSWFGGGGAEPLEVGDGHRALRAERDLERDEQWDLALILRGAGEEPERELDIDRTWLATEQGWQERVPELGVAVAARDAQQSYAVLSGMTSLGGGMVAAATTSLPERAARGRSFDYRYVWIRDQSYVGQAAASAGPHPLMDRAVEFVGARLLDDGERLMPAYTVDGDAVPRERELDLPGYPGGTDIAGNRVRDQFQLDAFGEALLLFAAAGRHDHLDSSAWRAVEAAAGGIESRWREADAGIWELEPARWAHSRLICAAGLRAIAAQAPRAESAHGWLALADALVADASSDSLHPSGRWQRSPDDPRLDAALVTAAIRGALPAEDPRSLATLSAVCRELTEEGYCYRFKAGELPLGEAEGAFLLCGFWLALAHAQLGLHAAAASWFERNRAACGSPGLFAEEFDVRQRQLRGNAPQAFVHALLLECAATLEPAADPSASFAQAAADGRADAVAARSPVKP